MEAGLKSMEEEALGAMEAVRSKEAELEGRKAEMEAARAEVGEAGAGKGTRTRGKQLGVDCVEKGAVGP